MLRNRTLCIQQDRGRTLTRLTLTRLNPPLYHPFCTLPCTSVTSPSLGLSVTTCVYSTPHPLMPHCSLASSPAPADATTVTQTPPASKTQINCLPLLPSCGIRRCCPFLGLVLFTSRLEAPPDSRTRAQFAPGLERNRASSSPELSGCHCTLPFSFETTKQKLNTRHLNINTVDLFPLAMYLLHL